MTLAFSETRINDGLVIYETVGGPGYSTDIAQTAGGGEQRNINWDESLGAWELGERMVDLAELQAIERFFRARKARGGGFRFKDWGNFSATLAEGLLGTGAGTGVATYDLWKRVTEGSDTDDKRIYKPVAGTVTPYRGGAPVTLGVGAGNAAVDAVNGQVTFVADASQNVAGVTVGASTVVTLAAAVAGFVVGGRLWLESLGGTVGAALNNLAHPITGISGAQYTLSTATTGLAYTSGGVGRKFPQPADTLGWAGQFDMPVRFDVERMRYQFKARESDGRMLFYLYSLPIVELRKP